MFETDSSKEKNAITNMKHVYSKHVSALVRMQY